MNKNGRPRKTLGTVFRRGNSRFWWVRYRDRRGTIVKESTGTDDRERAERFLRDRLDSRDDGSLQAILAAKTVQFNAWADWFLERRSKPPFRSEKTHRDNMEILKNLRPAFGTLRLVEITSDSIERYLAERLTTRRKIRTKLGVKYGDPIKPISVHRAYRVLHRILNVAVQQKVLAINPCVAVEFPARLNSAGRKPHYVTATEQAAIEAAAPAYLKNIVVIMTEMGLRPYRELLRMKKNQLDMVNGVAHIPDSKPPGGVADLPMTELATRAFQSQLALSEGSDYLFPTTRRGASKPHMTNLRKVWDSTLKRAGVPHFTLYELRHTFATRLSAGGVADHFVAQALCQDDSAVLKRYSQAKLQMLRDALGQLHRQANEPPRSFGAAQAS